MDCAAESAARHPGPLDHQARPRAPGAHGVSAVADTKYKLLDEKGNIPNADVYQLVTYATRLGLDSGHLIYAGDTRPPDVLEIHGSSVRVHIHAVDLTQPVLDIERQVTMLAHRLRPSELTSSQSNLAS